MADQEVVSKPENKDKKDKTNPWLQPIAVTGVAALFLTGLTLYFSSKNSDLEKAKFQFTIKNQSDQIAAQKEQLDRLYEEKKKSATLQNREIHEFDLKIKALGRELVICNKSIKTAQDEVDFYELLIHESTNDFVRADYKTSQNNLKETIDRLEAKRTELTGRIDDLSKQRADFILSMSISK